ncbi:hypothetical protein DYP60_01145 [Sphaerochaeta halotolerans]|jgi:quercetin dioxygenase-like cupin family protein|uniref:Cupin domain-containing protein n=1 Tax=Sphaerochaeta halotolerans TaxID=2293840 RepID=A0A372MK99_9SPIR|nr:cupin domain-containing protein [Sphaerochaeta halotolerans]RFU96205.1 hypothetical protein DYP60_01145 [Sphaerochaeta halotolerans]
MIETVYAYTKTDEKVIEKLVGDDQVMINHVVLGNGEALPEHFSDSNVYLTIVRGILSATFGDQEAHYCQGAIVNVPANTKMNIANTHDEPVEFFIVKAPHPRVYKEQ